MFISTNIRTWILRECLQSGSPEEFFREIMSVVDDIEHDSDVIPDFWDKAWDEIGECYD